MRVILTSCGRKTADFAQARTRRKDHRQRRLVHLRQTVHYLQRKLIISGRGDTGVSGDLKF